MGDLRCISTSRPIQNGPIMVRTGRPAAHPDIHRAAERGSATGWTVTSHADHAVFVDRRKAEAADRRRR